MVEFRKIHVLDERPSQAPAGAIVLNAPRPLLASEIEGKYHYWQGRFVHGIFYAAVSPEDERILALDLRDDAWEVVYWKRADAIEWARNYYLTNFAGRHGIVELVAEAEDQDLISCWHNQHNK